MPTRTGSVNEFPVERCNICKRPLNTDDRDSRDCGGDCWGCVREVSGDLGEEPDDEGILACENCSRPVREGEHHGHGSEVLCGDCYGGRFDAHADKVAAEILDEIAEAVRSGELSRGPDSVEHATRESGLEARGLEHRFGEEYATAVQREAERRAIRRLENVLAERCRGGFHEQA